MKILSKEKQTQSEFNTWSLKQLGLLSSLSSLIILSVLLVVVFLNKGQLSRFGYWQIQIDWFIYLNHFLSTWPASFWFALTSLGDAAISIPLLAFLIILKPQTATLFASLPITLVLVRIGKMSSAIPRPPVVLDPHLFTIIGDTLHGYNSFPSGHSTYVFTVTVSILLALIPSKNRKVSHWIFISISLFVAAMLCLSRVAVGAHWPLDILVGASCGALAAIGGTFVVQKYKNKWKWLDQKNRGYFLLGLSVLFCSFISIKQAIQLPLSHSFILWFSALSGLVLSLCLLSKFFLPIFSRINK